MSSIINPIWPNLYLSLSIYLTIQDIFRETEPTVYIHIHYIYIYRYIYAYVYMHIYIYREREREKYTYTEILILRNWLMLLWNLQSPFLHFHLLSVSWRPRETEVLSSRLRRGNQWTSSVSQEERTDY